MINLSERLSAIEAEISRGETVADIGTDHGFLPLKLVENGKSSKVIMTDISKGSLQKSVDNADNLNDKSPCHFRQGDGLEVIERGEVDAIVMAGMGGLLIVEMLQWDIAKSKSFKKFIFQPRSNSGTLRKWLYDNGFNITREQLVKEKNRICEIITALYEVDESVAKEGNVDVDIQMVNYEFPDALLENDSGLAEEYLTGRLKAEEKILSKIAKGKSLTSSKSDLENDSDCKAHLETIKRITYLLDLL